MGIQIEDIKTSGGPIVEVGDTVRIFYKLALTVEDLIANKFIESTYAPDVPIEMKVHQDELLEGVYRGILGMRAGGSIRRIIIPAEMAYGDKSWETIPANSDLVMDVCVTKVLKTGV